MPIPLTVHASSPVLYQWPQRESPVSGSLSFEEVKLIWFLERISHEKCYSTTFKINIREARIYQCSRDLIQCT